MKYFIAAVFEKVTKYSVITFDFVLTTFGHFERYFIVFVYQREEPWTCSSNVWPGDGTIHDK